MPCGYPNVRQYSSADCPYLTENALRERLDIIFTPGHHFLPMERSRSFSSQSTNNTGLHSYKSTLLRPQALLYILLALVVTPPREKNIMIIQTVPTTKEHCESSPHSSVDTQKNPENALGRGTTTIEKVTITTSESIWARSTEEKQLVRKLDMRIMPLTCLLYLFACEFFYCTISAPSGLLLT